MIRHLLQRFAALGFLLVACPLFLLEGRPVKVTTFHYYRDVQLPPNTGAAYGRILLDEAVAIHSFGTDLRMTLGGQPVPHFTRTRAVTAFSKGKVTILHQERTESTVIYVVQVAGAPAGMMPVELEVVSESNFESAVRVQSGTRPGEWHEGGHASVYRYGSDAGHIRLPDGGPYYRLEFDGKREFTFPSVRYALARTDAEFRIAPGPDWKQDYDSDEQATVFYYANPSHRGLSRITLQFAEERYRRPVTFLRFDRTSKSYEHFFSALLFRKGGSSVQSIEFQGSTSDAIKLIVKDGDDAPLHLQEVLLYGPMEELVFQIPDLTDQKEKANLRIYYGNRYASEPEFDLKQSFEPALRMADVDMGPEQNNEAFAYSIVEPPVSTWVIRIIFLLGLAAMAYPAWRILSRYAERIGSA